MIKGVLGGLLSGGVVSAAILAAISLMSAPPAPRSVATAGLDEPAAPATPAPAETAPAVPADGDTAPTAEEATPAPEAEPATTEPAQPAPTAEATPDAGVIAAPAGSEFDKPAVDAPAAAPAADAQVEAVPAPAPVAPGTAENAPEAGAAESAPMPSQGQEATALAEAPGTEAAPAAPAAMDQPATAAPAPVPEASAAAEDTAPALPEGSQPASPGVAPAAEPEAMPESAPESAPEPSPEVQPDEEALDQDIVEEPPYEEPLPDEGSPDGSQPDALPGEAPAAAAPGTVPVAVAKRVLPPVRKSGGSPEAAALGESPAAAAPASDLPPVISPEVPEAPKGVTGAPKPGFARSVPGVRVDRLPTVETAPQAEAAPLPSAVPGTPAETPAETPSVTPAAEADRPDIPMHRYAAAFENPGKLPVLAVVVIDIGNMRGGADLAQILALPAPVTVAINPMGKDSPEAAARSRAQGFELAILADGLPKEGTGSDVEVAYQSISAAMPDAVAVMTSPESTLLARRPVAQQVVAILKDEGLGLVSYARGLSPARELARGRGLPQAEVTRVVDEPRGDAAAVLRVLEAEAFQAQQKGGGVVVLRSYPDSLAALAQFMAKDGLGVKVGPVTAALK